MASCHKLYQCPFESCKICAVITLMDYPGREFIACSIKEQLTVFVQWS